jgi:GTP cyclohydrolase IA
MTTRHEKFAEAVTHLLQAAGVDLADPELKGTPQKVAELWLDDLLKGTSEDPAEILQKTVPGTSDAVFVFDLSFHSMCPHHLLPYRGRVHVGYLPKDKLVGFGRLARLVTCLSRRLTLQENICEEIPQLLIEHLDARGAGCVIEAEQLCLALPDDRHEGSLVLTSSFAGEFAERSELRQRLLNRPKKI